MKSILCSALRVGLMLMVVSPCCADEGLPRPDSRIEIIQFKAPAGWKASDQAGKATGRLFAAPDSDANQQAMILILVYPAQEGFDFRAAFDSAVKDVTSNGKVLEAGVVTPAKTRQGFDALSIKVVTEAPGAQRIYTRMIAAKVQNRMAGIYYLASSQKSYDLHQPDMDALLKSVSFDVGAAAPVSDEQLLLKARERFAKDVAARRQAHTISGNILASDGKPIPNVDSYRVFVWGTTIAAQTTHYGLEVDANGHFEQQIPDGLYQIKATCIVNNGGHRLPVELICLDDKKPGIDQASSGGIVKDFCLAMGGLKPGADPKEIASYYGGTMSVTGPVYQPTTGSFSTRHPGATVQLTLTPQGPTVDGSQRPSSTIGVNIADLDYGAHLGKIPLGAYRLTATLVGKNGAKQALLCSRTFEGEYATSAEVFWECSRDDQETRADPTVYLKE